MAWDGRSTTLLQRTVILPQKRQIVVRCQAALERDQVKKLLSEVEPVARVI